MYVGEQIRIKLKRWILLSTVIRSTHMSHEHRAQRIGVLERLVREAADPYGTANYGTLQVWALVLLELLHDTRFEHDEGPFSYVSHIDVKNTLRLFEDTCQYMYEHWDDDYFAPYHYKSNYYETQPKSPQMTHEDTFDDSDSPDEAFNRWIEREDTKRLDILEKEFDEADKERDKWDDILSSLGGDDDGEDGE